MAIVAGSKKEKAPRVDVEFTYMRDDEPEVFYGQAALSLDAAGMRRTLVASQRESADVLDALFSTIAKMMDNKDGVPDGWRPVALPRDKSIPENAEDSFRAPYGEDKGKIVPMSRAAEFLAFEAGSTRRRWNHLINVDEGAVVDAGDATEFFERLVSAAANRPTEASS